MLEKGKISGLAFFFISMNIVGATAVVFLPAVAFKFAGRDAWLTAVLAIIPGIAVVLLVTDLHRRFPGKTLIEYLQIIIGQWPGKLVGILFLFFFIHTNAFVIRQSGEMLAILTMPRTPVIVFNAVLVLLAAYAVRSGLEVIARLFELLTPGITILYTLILLFGLQKAEFHNLLPVLENGLAPVLLGSLSPAAWQGEVVVLAMILPYLVKPHMGRNLAIRSAFVIGSILTAGAVVIAAVYGPMAARLVLPIFSIPSEIIVGGFLRIDVFVIIIWMAIVLLKASVLYYAAVLGTAQLLNLKDYRPVILPLGVFMTALSVLAVNNSAEILSYITFSWPPFAFLFELVIPLALLLIAVARGFNKSGE